MHPLEIERWALRVADQVASRGHAEDSLVELKATWPDPVDAARKIAAHANAARGATVLWIIGIDEEDGVCGATVLEVADWLAAVVGQFDGVYPEMTNVNVALERGTIVALAFNTDRAPYVVRNPRFGQPHGGAIKWEVPWREGSSTRTATRHDLLRLLAPLQPLPDIECLDFRVRVAEEPTDSVLRVHKWYAEGSLYVAPVSGTTVTIPSHRSSVMVREPDAPEDTYFQTLHLYVHDKSESNPVAANHAGATIKNPGMLFFSASLATPASERTYPDGLGCELKLQPVGALVPLRIVVTLRPSKRGNAEVASWSLRG